jgi:prophage DNA circulation protein
LNRGLVPQGLESCHARIEALAEYMRMAYRGVDEIEMIFDRVELPAVFGDVAIEFLIHVDNTFDDEVDLIAKILDTGFNRLEAMLDGIEAMLNTAKAMLDMTKAVLDAVKALLDTIEALRDAVKALVDTIETLLDTVKALLDTIETLFDSVKALFDMIEALLDTINPRVDLRKLLAHFGAGFFDPRAQCIDPRAEACVDFFDPRAEEFEAVLDQVDQVLLCHAGDGTSEIARYLGAVQTARIAVSMVAGSVH